MMSSLREKAKLAVIWNAGFNLFRDVIQFVVMLVLVRLLAPDSYGQFSLVTSIISFLSVFSFSNFVAHTLQVRDDSMTYFEEHFTAGAVLQLGMFLITNLTAAALHWVPRFSSISPLVHLMSLTFILEWPCELRRKMIERRFDWRSLRLLHGVGLLLNGVVAIVMAKLGAGTYALVAPGLTVTLPFIYDLFIRQGWRPTWSWSWEKYKPAWVFGLTRICSGLTLNSRQLLESGVLTGVLGFAMLGVVNRSLGLAQIFCLKVATQLIYAIYPILTRVISGQANSQRVTELVLRVVAWTVVPTAVFFSVLSEPIVRTIYGIKWLEVVPLLPWAMTWGAMAAITHAAYMLLLACHQQQKCLLADLLGLAGTGLSLWLALPFGLFFYLAGLILTQIIVLSLLVIWLRSTNAIARLTALDALLSALASAAIAALAATFLLRTSFPFVPSSLGYAVSWGVSFAALDIAVLRIAFQAKLSTILAYLPAGARISRLLLMTPEAISIRN